MVGQVGLSINQRIRVALANSDEYYTSSVEDITADRLFIAVPLRRRIPLTLSRGDQVRVQFTGDGECFSFVTTVTGRREEGVVLYGLAFPEQVERVQRRREVRLSLLMDVFYAEVPEGDDPPVFKETKALDLSASGMRLVTKEGYVPGTYLIVRFTLPMQNSSFEVAAKARVVRQEPVVIDREMLYHVGVKFVDLTQSQRDRIFSYIFWRMMEDRRAGKVF